MDTIKELEAEVAVARWERGSLHVGRPYVVAKKKDGSFGVREFGLFSEFEVVTL